MYIIYKGNLRILIAKPIEDPQTINFVDSTLLT